MRGNSFANSQPGHPGWDGGCQAPRPVTHWDFTEGDKPCQA
jgi:hypothetical protein